MNTEDRGLSIAGARFARAHHAGATPLEALKTWLDVIHELTKLDINYELDRLPAIS